LTVRCFRNDCRPDGRCPPHVAGLGVGGQAGVYGGLLSGQVSGRPCAPATSVDTGPVLAAATADMHRVRPGSHAVSETLRSQARAFTQGEHGWCPAGTASSVAVPDTSAVAVRDAVQVPDTRGHPAASGVIRRMRSYRNRSPGWRPLVGCSQRW
jgi:hypothetical protein